ncbi:hypothetical protein EAG18_10935 [Pseudoalteromonas sp. J010]|uniref:hypothetical protein n=1 Tax=Pseudoalteromonas sp. J010 TaxID=998465 RepID=UPI000F652446|nr:hypothetical protein [Pseudoalteromonas sp. J010]RRS08701.1 hypothetical protein EAG18_10935 [Pseudoalteromonas sp. J010]
MRFIITFLTLVLLSACSDFEPIKKVGYAKKLDTAVNEKCFERKFLELKNSTTYILTVKTEKSAGKIKSYDLTLDGTESDDSHEVFTPESFKLSKEFMKSVIENCTYLKSI